MFHVAHNYLREHDVLLKKRLGRMIVKKSLSLCELWNGHVVEDRVIRIIKVKFIIEELR